MKLQQHDVCRLLSFVGGNHSSILLGNCNIRAIQPLTRAASTDQRLYFLCLSIESRRDPELTFLPSFCERSANEMPTFRSTSQKGIRAKRAKEYSLQYSGNQTLFCAKNTTEYVFIYELKCFKSIFTEFINFSLQRQMAAPFAVRKQKAE